MIKLKKHTKQSRNSMELKATTSAALKALRSIFPDWTKEGLDIERGDSSSGEAFVDIEIIKETGDCDERMMTVCPHFLSRTVAGRWNTAWITVRRRYIERDNCEFVCWVKFPHDTGLDECRVSFQATFKGYERFDVRSLAARALKHALDELLEAQPEPEPEPEVLVLECARCREVKPAAKFQRGVCPECCKVASPWNSTGPEPVMTFGTVNGAGEVHRDRDSKEWTINAPEGSERMYGTPSEVRARVEQLKEQAAKPEPEGDTKLDAYTDLVGRVCSTFSAES